MFDELTNINRKPKPFEFYTAEDLWTNEHTSKKMLEFLLGEASDISSRSSDFIDRSVSWIVDQFNLNSSSRLIDFGCGTGLYTNNFAEKGINVIGVDFSKSSLDYAWQIALNKNLNVEYILENYLEFKTKLQFDLVTMIMCDFSALSPTQRKVMLGKYRNLLKPKGKILLDIYSLDFFNAKEEMATYESNFMGNFWSPEDYYCFINIIKYVDMKVLLEKHTIVEKKQTRVVYNWLQCFSLESLKREFEENDLVIEEIYADVSGQSYNPESFEFAVVARAK